METVIDWFRGRNNHGLNYRIMQKINHNFPATQYVREETKKCQIVLHHTVSGDGVNGDVNWWMSNPDLVATHFIIDREGVVHQFFAEKYWAYHLGLSSKHFSSANVPYKNLDKTSVGIALDSWGPLLPGTDGKFYPVKWDGNRNIPNTYAKPVKYFYEYCQQNRWHGHMYYEKYTTAQLASLKELLQQLCAKHNIPKQYDNNMWAVYAKALRGDDGVFAHCTYRNDKSDVHPQPELLTLLKTL